MISAPDPYALTRYFDDWTKLEDAKDKLGEQLLEFFAKARKAGFDGKTMRAAFRIKRHCETDTAAALAENANLERYLAALGVTKAMLSRVAREEVADEVSRVARESVPPNSIKARAREINERARAKQAAGLVA